MNLEVFCSDQQVVKKIMKIFPLKFENKLQSCYILESLRRRIVTHIYHSKYPHVHIALSPQTDPKTENTKRARILFSKTRIWLLFFFWKSLFREINSWLSGVEKYKWNDTRWMFFFFVFLESVLQCMQGHQSINTSRNKRTGFISPWVLAVMKHIIWTPVDSFFSFILSLHRYQHGSESESETKAEKLILFNTWKYYIRATDVFRWIAWECMRVGKKCSVFWKFLCASHRSCRS